MWCVSRGDACVKAFLLYEGQPVLDVISGSREGFGNCIPEKRVPEKCRSQGVFQKSVLQIKVLLNKRRQRPER
jgi:hypothetical protein